MPADVGVQAGAQEVGWWGVGGVCDQSVIGEGNRQRRRREAAAAEMQTAAGGAEGSEAQPDQDGRQPGGWSVETAAL